MSASSSIRQKGDDHPPEHAFDGNPKTAWNESAPGPGKGEWLEAKFDAPQSIRRIKLTTGYAEVSPKYGDLFVANAHLKRVTVLVDGQPVRTVDVAADQREITLEGIAAHGEAVRIRADEVWEGAKWQDLCISEVEIYAN